MSGDFLGEHRSRKQQSAAGSRQVLPRSANRLASVAIWLPKNVSFKRPWKMACKSQFWQSPIGFPCRDGMLFAKGPCFQVVQLEVNSVSVRSESATAKTER